MMHFKVALFAGALAIAASAQAAVFTVIWNGAQFGNSARAIGHFDINTGAHPELRGEDNFLNFPDANFQLLDLTVSGSSSGNGSFVQSDFDAFVFSAFSPLNYSQELIGQPLGNGCTFGDFGACYPGPSGDFNLFGSFPTAPTGSFYFELTTSGGGGDRLAVTSIKAALPEPASWALMIGGFGMVGGALRSRRKVALTA